MKKAIKVLFVILALLGAAAGGLCAYAAYIYRGVDEGALPEISVEVQGSRLEEIGYEWYAKVFSFPLVDKFNHKYLMKAPGLSSSSLGVFEENALSFKFPENYESTIVLTQNGEEIYSGGQDGFSQSLISENAAYTMFITSEKAFSENEGYGKIFFRADFVIDVPPPPAPAPSYELSETSLYQGQVLIVKASYIQGGSIPQIETELGSAVFTPLADDGQLWASPVTSWQALVPVGNVRKPGDYSLKILVDEESVFVQNIKVLDYEFPFQNLIIDTSDTSVSEASSAKAYAEFREKIHPLRETADDSRYWEGLFLHPVEGRITTEFGTERITNGNQSTWRAHYGIDIAAPEGTKPEDFVGTAIQAPNNGRVVFAEYLLNTGYTIVIEHGGGLKTYYFHMSEIDVKENDMVKAGDIIGKVGSTGYSSGPHLHYEMRIGDQAVDPGLFYDEGFTAFS